VAPLLGQPGRQPPLDSWQCPGSSPPDPRAALFWAWPGTGAG